MATSTASATASTRPYAIVTGATRGLGLAIATALHDSGFDVSGIGRSKPPPESLTRLSPSYELHRCDLTRPHDVEDLFASTLAPRIRNRPRVVLVNNAGTIGPVGPTSSLSTSMTELDDTIRLNLTTPMWLSGAVLRAAETDPKVSVRIINISSGAADGPYPGWSAYCATKAGLRMAGRVIASDSAEFVEFKGRDVRVLDYAPGVVDTDMQLQVRTADRAAFPRVDKFVGLHESGALARPEDSARTVVEFALGGEGEAYVQARHGS